MLQGTVYTAIANEQVVIKEIKLVSYLCDADDEGGELEPYAIHDVHGVTLQHILSEIDTAHVKWISNH